MSICTPLCFGIVAHHSKYGANTVGVLKLKVCSANLTRNTAVFETLDPYVELKIDGFSPKKTNVK